MDAIDEKRQTLERRLIHLAPIGGIEGAQMLLNDADALALAVLDEACAAYDLNGFGCCAEVCKHTDCATLGNALRALRARLSASPAAGGE